MPQFGYLPYLNVVEQVIIVICMLLSIGLFSNLLFRVAVGNQGSLEGLSSSMVFYMSFHVLMSVTAFPYSAYQMFEWFNVVGSIDHEVHKKAADQLFFWFGIFNINYVTVAPLPTLFLTFDRCLVLNFKGSYEKPLRKKMLLANCLLIGVVYLSLTFTSVLELPLDLNKTQNCIQIACFSLKLRTLPHYYTKLVLESANLVLGLYFFVMLRRYRHSQTTRNRVIKLTLLAEIVLIIFPTYIATIFNTVTGASIVNYLGNFNSTPFMVHAALCGVMYTKIFLGKSKDCQFLRRTKPQTVHTSSSECTINGQKPNP
ncbi:hypothetical protein Ddc_21267 [Ditylenchus destructor]|nr:hypothetical protein Ddc_21267 [Ditylenchus destructor]